MRIVWAVSLGLLMSWPAAPASAASAADKDAKAVKDLIEKTVTSILTILKDEKATPEQRRKKVQKLVDPIFDLKLMGKLVLGRKHWPKLKKAEREEFTHVFVTTMQDAYYDKLDLFSDETVEFEEPLPGKKGKYVMPTTITSKGKSYKLIYKVYRKKGAWKVYDMELEGISLVRAYGSQYDQFLQKSSFKELIKRMREKGIERPKDIEKILEDEVPASKAKAKPKKKKGSKKS